jgi:hypothetical protein
MAIRLATAIRATVAAELRRESEMSDPSDIKYAEQLLMRSLMEWRDAGGSVESVTGSILRLIVAREAFATMVRAEKETRCEHGERDGYCIVCHNPDLNRRVE